MSIKTNTELLENYYDYYHDKIKKKYIKKMKGKKCNPKEIK